MTTNEPRSENWVSIEPDAYGFLRMLRLILEAGTAEAQTEAWNTILFAFKVVMKEDVTDYHKSFPNYWNVSG
jgi:hypothetical protein